MASAPPIDASKYSHSPVHAAVLARDYDALRRELASLPRLSDPSSILTEPDSLAEESKADAISAAVDRRDVPGRETPLHLAVRLSDPTSADLLMSAGADWSLQNDLGWSALQEAVSARDEALARVIVRRYQPLAWAKWCRRLPRLVAVMSRMRDFYMEISFHFESSVIPFISRVAPSDTYRIWKRGASLRADMTLAGFDGFRIKRSDQSVLFLGEGSEDGRVPPGALCILSHKSKEVMNALEGAGAPPTEKEVQHEVSSMLKTSILRPGIDVTKAVLLPQMTWRRQERKDTIGPWKAKVYDLHNVVVSVKSRQVPGAPGKGKVQSSGNESEIDADEFADVLTEEERKQLEDALKMDCSDSVSDGYIGQRHSSYERRDILAENTMCSGDNVVDQDKGKGGEKQKHDGKKNIAQARSSLSVDGKVSDLLGESPPHIQSRTAKPSATGKGADLKGGDDRDSKESCVSSENGIRKNGDGKDSEFRKGLRPVLWLSPNFPLQTDELLPLLDILANKVKAIRRLRELLTTKLPPGTFPVKVAIPVVPTIRVLVTFTKFEELQPSEEFSTPPSSPEQKSPKLQPSNSWRHWMKGTNHGNYPPRPGASSCVENIQEPFLIPQDYTWITPEAKKKRMVDRRRKSSKARSQKKRSTDNVH